MTPTTTRNDEDLVDAAHELERIKRLLWHGNVYRALQTIGWLGDVLWREHPEPERAKLTKALSEFEGYIRANASSIPSTPSATSPARRSRPPSSSRP